MKPNSKKQNDFQIEKIGTKLSDSTEIANAFNDYFSSVAPSLATQIPDFGTDPISYLPRNPHSFVYFEVDSAKVKKQILSFKSKPSNIKTIPSFAYKCIGDVLSLLLAKLIKQFFEEGIFPSGLKTARVIPIHKAAFKYKVNNYRLISTLQFLSKVMEKLIHARITNFFELTYSFLNKRNSTAPVLLDFNKEFDTIDYNILVKK